MKLWHLTRNDKPQHYDEYDSFVIRAPSEGIARSMAQSLNGSETHATPLTHNPHNRDWSRRPFWTDPSLASCTELTPDGEALIITADYKAG